MKKTIALACILKNEVNNIDQFLSSVEGCFDEIHMTDTGSDDGSIELLERYSKGENPANTKLFLHHFKWVDDFSKARNASFKPVETDYLAWMDLDDVMSDKKAFIEWRDSIMPISEFWLATYNYAYNKEGISVCSFARERVIARSLNCQWKYFVHEGLIPPANCSVNYAVTWSINHKRTDEDVKKDRSRNLKLFEGHELDPRMQYYYGKELFENGSTLEAYTQLIQSARTEKIEVHDRIMAIQYAAMCAMLLNQFNEAIKIAHSGLMLEPQRAEYFVCIADSYLKLNKPSEAIPFYKAASSCAYRGDGIVKGAIYTDRNSYRHYPLNQLARIYANLGQIELAERYAKEAITHGDNIESAGILLELEKLKKVSSFGIKVEKKKTEDIVISCLPQGFYEWDEEIYANRGIGGSETAVCEIAKRLQIKTGRDVIIFNNRDAPRSFGQRHYRSAKELPAYFSEYAPKVNINWRHNIKLTDSPTYIWCHDLGCEGIDRHQDYEKLICLSEFHKNYVHSLFGVPNEKIWVSRNGINETRFLGEHGKVPGKVIFSSSPDRGLDNAMLVMDKVVKAYPEAKLHAFYGFDNLIKAGRMDVVERIKKMIDERPYVVMHGNVDQTTLTKEMSESEVWLYPTNFLETFCITAIEALNCKTYPIVRKWGALPDTLKKAREANICDVLDFDCKTEAETERYALAVVDALQEKKWKKVEVDPMEYSWDRVADEWIEYMGL